MDRIKSKKISFVCKSCGELKTDHFSNGMCLPCNRVHQLIKLYSNNLPKLEESIAKDEKILGIKKSILAGVHPITKKSLLNTTIYHCFKNGEYLGRFEGINKKDVFRQIPDIVKSRNQKAWDSMNNEYKLVTIKN